MTSPTIDPAAALARLDTQETLACRALDAARAAHDAVVKHVFALKLAELVARVPGFASVALESEGAYDDQGDMYMSVIATVILDEDVNNAAVDAPDADLDPDSGLLDVDEAEEQVRALVDHYGEGLLNIWENDTITAAALPALVESALAFAAANPAATAADG